MDISVVIATLNREKELEKCIHSILNQTCKPCELVIVDDGNLSQESIRKLIPPPIKFQYYHKDVPSLSASRNIGAQLATSELVLFLDDDIVLESHYIAEILKVFMVDTRKEIGGVSGIIVNAGEKPSLLKYWEKIFLHNRGRPGQILPWGFYTRIEGIDKVTEVNWVPGGLSCFRREVFNDFQLYDFSDYNHKGGRHGLADIEFSLRVGKRYRFAVTPFARLFHYPPSATKKRSFQTGYKQAFNHGVIFQKYLNTNLLNKLCFLWANCGLILGNFGAVILVKGADKRQARLYRAFGNISGIVHFIMKRQVQWLRK